MLGAVPAVLESATAAEGAEAAVGLQQIYQQLLTAAAVAVLFEA